MLSVAEYFMDNSSDSCKFVKIVNIQYNVKQYANADCWKMQHIDNALP